MQCSAGSLVAELCLGSSPFTQNLRSTLESGLISQRRRSRQIFYQVSKSSSARLPSLYASICEGAPKPSVYSENDVAKPSTMAAVIDLAIVGSG